MFCECAEHEAHDEDSGEESDGCGVVQVMVEVSDADEDDTDDDVHKAPQDIDDGRGQSSARRLGEGRGE